MEKDLEIGGYDGGQAPVGAVRATGLLEMLGGTKPFIMLR